MIQFKIVPHKFNVIYKIEKEKGKEKKREEKKILINNVTKKNCVFIEDAEMD